MPRPILAQHGNLANRLLEAGVIPPMTTKFQIVVIANEPVKLVTESWLTGEQYETVVNALEENRAEVVRELLFSNACNPFQKIKVVL